jgi:hypothetical protein
MAQSWASKIKPKEKKTKELLREILDDKTDTWISPPKAKGPQIPRWQDKVLSRVPKAEQEELENILQYAIIKGFIRNGVRHETPYTPHSKSTTIQNRCAINVELVFPYTQPQWIPYILNPHTVAAIALSAYLADTHPQDVETDHFIRKDVGPKNILENILFPT